MNGSNALNMSFEIPASIEPEVRRFADAKHISADEAVLQLITAGLKAQPDEQTKASGRPSYASMFGAAKGGPGAHGSPEAVDRYIAELRNEW